MLVIIQWILYFFLNLIFILSWNIADLQYCVSFRCTAKWFSFIYIYIKVKVLVAQSCPILCDPMNCSPPDSSAHGILQVRILELIATSFSRRSSQPRNRTQVSHIVVRFFTIWATRKIILSYIWIYIYMKQSLCCTPETNMSVYIYIKNTEYLYICNWIIFLYNWN